LVAVVTSADVPRPSIGYLLWQVALTWRVAMDRALAPVGLTNAQYAVLASLHGLSRAGARPSQRELADFSGLEPMYVSKLVRALERAGLLRRAAHPADPRAVELTLTRHGSEVVETAAATVRELHDRLLTPLGGSQSTRSAELSELLQTLRQHAVGVNGAPTPSDDNPPIRKPR
jgi:DNA-binding MarR family transcriptional regulator